MKVLFNVKTHTWFLGCSLTVLSGVAAAQSLPVPPGGANASGIQADQQRQQERLEERRRTQEAVTEAVVEQSAETETGLDGGATFVLTSVKFTPTEQLTREELTALIKPQLGQQTSLADLNQLVQAVNQLYRQKQIYTSVAILPQQRIENGVVIIQLVEGELGEIHVQGASWTQADWIRDWVEPDVPEGSQSLNMQALESDILVFNRLHDQYLQAQLRSGSSFGKTDMVLSVIEPSARDYQLWTDNYGYTSSGDWGMGALFRQRALFAQSDRAMVYANATEGAKTASLDYNTGLGLSRWRIGASGNYTQSAVIAGDFAEAEVESRSTQVGAYASYLMWSAPNAWLEIRPAFNRTLASTDVVDEVLSESQVDKLSLMPVLTWLGQNWRVSGSLSYAYTEVDDKLSDQPSRDFNVWNGSVSGMWRAQTPVYLMLRYEQQYADDTGLPGTVAYNLGGPSSVRGYEPGFVSGDRGQLAQMEVHYDGGQWLNNTVDVFAFYDRGDVKSIIDDYRITSAGFGVSIYGDSGLSLDLSAGNILDARTDRDDEWRLYARLGWNF